MDNQVNLTYVMGQLDLHFTQSQLSQFINHYNQQKGLSAQLKLWMPDPPLSLNLRELTPAKEPVLTSQQINQLKQSSPSQPNVTLFIHGYNVGLGGYGSQLYTADKQASTFQQVEYIGTKSDVIMPNELYFTDIDATVMRSPQHLIKTFTSALKLGLNDDRLNGEGAHNWWLHMEYNLNKAAGFEGFDYHYQHNKPQYTRILNIAWAGDPASPLDYMAIEPIAEATALKLIPVIRQLRKHKIAINIIAHSAGNIVLLKLMNQIADPQQRQPVFNNVFMWQAACPDNALSPSSDHEDDSLTGFWRLPNAAKSANRIHVLYSYHDNILGPIPLDLNGNKNSQIIKKWKMPGGGKGMAAMALALDVIDQQTGAPNALKSCYNVAHLFHVPFNVLLFEDALRRQLYQKWYKKYGSHYGKSSHQPCLIDQASLLEKTYHHIFDDLALFVSLYSAIIHDGILAFLANVKNDKRLSKWLLSMTPVAAAHVMKNVLHAARTTVNHHDWHKIIHEMARYSRRHVHYFYLKVLTKTMLYHDVSAIKHGVTDTLHFFFSKSHDFILQPPYKLMLHNTQLEYQTWLELQKYFKNKSSQKKMALSKRGALLARRGNEVAAFVITILNTRGAEPRPALGYSGGNMRDRQLKDLYTKNKINQHDQSNYLFHHSGMKVTNFDDAIFKHAYRGIIMNAEGMQFGKFIES